MLLPIDESSVHNYAARQLRTSLPQLPGYINLQPPQAYSIQISGLKQSSLSQGKIILFLPLPNQTPYAVPYNHN